MNARFVTLALIILVFVMAVAFKTDRIGMQERSSVDQSVDDFSIPIKDRVVKAKSDGTRLVVLSGGVGIYAEVTDLDDALAHFDVVVAEPVESLSYITESQNIATWYKFRILETVSQSEAPYDCASCGSSFDVPEELLPLNPNEILVPQAGGTVIVDGVNVTQRHELPESVYTSFSLEELPVKHSETAATHFKTHQRISTTKRYLLFLQRKDSHSVALLALGPRALYSVSPDNKLEQVAKEPHTLGLSIKEKYGNSLNRMSQYVKEKKLR